MLPAIKYVSEYWVYYTDENGALCRHTSTECVDLSTTMYYHKETGLLLLAQSHGGIRLDLSSDAIVWCSFTKELEDLIGVENTNVDGYYIELLTDSILIIVEDLNSGGVRFISWKTVDDVSVVEIPYTIDANCWCSIGQTKNHLYLTDNASVYRITHDLISQASKENDWKIMFNNPITLPHEIDVVTPVTPFWAVDAPDGEYLKIDDTFYLVNENGHARVIERNAINDIEQHDLFINDTENNIALSVKYSVDKIHSFTSYASNQRIEIVDVEQEVRDYIYGIFIIDSSLYVESDTNLYLIGHYNKQSNSWTLEDLTDFKPLVLSQQIITLGDRNVY